MKYLKFILIILFLTFININVVYAADCVKKNAVCSRYTKNDQYNNKNYTIEIGTADNNNYLAISYDNFVSYKEATRITGNNYEIAFMDLEFKTHYSIYSQDIDEVFKRPSNLTVSFASENSNNYYYRILSGNNTSQQGPTTSGNCYHEGANCKQYSEIDKEGKTYKIELGKDDSIGNYFVVSYDNFQTILGEGTNGNYRISKDNKIFVIYEPKIFDSLPSSININVNGDSYTGYYEYVISGSGDTSQGVTGNTTNPGNGGISNGGGYTDMDCGGLLGDPNDSNYPAYWLQLALKILRYIGMAALVVLSTIDFVQAIVKQDNDALIKAIKTTAKRFVFAVLLFFAPMLVEFIMSFFGVYGTCSL